jgi:hypothetical protein
MQGMHSNQRRGYTQQTRNALECASTKKGEQARGQFSVSGRKKRRLKLAPIGFSDFVALFPNVITESRVRQLCRRRLGGAWGENMGGPDSDGVERRGTDLDPRYSAVVIHGGVAYLTGQTSYAYSDTRYARPEEFVRAAEGKMF